MAMESNLHLAEALIGLTQPDIVLPSQHFGARRKQAPEQRLMIAVLHDAFDCVEKYRNAMGTDGRRLFREAQRWFLSDEPDWPYSFECICGALDLDSDAIRQRLGLTPGPRTSPRATPNGYRQTEILKASTSGHQWRLTSHSEPTKEQEQRNGDHIGRIARRGRPTTPRDRQPKRDV